MLKILFVGEGLVLAGAIEIAQSRGHDVVGVFCTSASEAAVMARTGLTVAGPSGKVAPFVASTPCDAIISIANGRILDAETLARPKIAAINYHNGPLPAYAGRWATPWAILNGEPLHGITWHLMAPGIDTGAILEQRRFALTTGETTGSLNMRCSEAALASFPEVLARLERGALAGAPQDFSNRSYFGRSDTAPNGGMIDWQWDQTKILRLVRACDWGSSANSFGEARVALPDGSIQVVRSATSAKAAGVPGTILNVDGSSLTIACSDGAVRLQLRDVEIPPPGIGSAKAEVNVLAQADALPMVSQMITALATAGPHMPAILGERLPVSRKDLLARANGFAAKLQTLGLRRDAGVGLLLPMGSDFVAGALGTMMAGGAYVPLNPSSPPKRLAFEIAEAGVTHIIGEPIDGLRPSDIPGIVFISPTSIGDADPVWLPEIARGQCAYRIFTSGSTGRPKAVEISHASLANLVAHYHEALSMGPGDRMTALAHPTFDASVGDIWPILAAGGVLLIPPNDILLDPAALIGWLRDASATCTFVPTAVAERLFGIAWPERMELKTLLTGGSALHHRPPPGLSFKVINTYGPTENTVDSLWGYVSPAGGRPTIGKPIRGVTAQIVDENGKIVRAGDTGELVLGGAQLALGYRGRPDLTEEKFPIREGERTYRTGDLARIDLHGDYEFRGRVDDQVQVMGIRVEPGEIEAVLKADPMVADAICLPLQVGEQITGIIAHVAPRPGVEASAARVADLRQRLKDQLPAALVPRELRVHDALPYTSAGKIDRRALVELDMATRTQAAGFVTETDPLRAIWQACLPASTDAGEDESFWTLGGDSLAAIELLMRLEKEAGLHLPVGAFLADPSLRGIRRAKVHGTAPDPSARLPNDCKRQSNIVTLQPEGEAAPLYLIHGFGGGLLTFRHFAEAIGPRRAVYALEAAPKGDDNAEPCTVSELASLYADHIIAHSRGGPINLMGYSIGGWYAHAVAAALHEKGATLGLIAILDTRIGPLIDLKVRLRLLPGGFGRQLDRIFRKLRIVVRFSDVRTPITGGVKSAQPGNVLPRFDPFVVLLRSHRPPRLPVAVDVFSPRKESNRIAPLWRHYAMGGVHIHPLFDNHLDFLEASHATKLAAAIEKALIRVET